MTQGPGSHSPVGASSIKRVLKCPASVALAVGIEDEESDHAALGTAVHALIEHCFKHNLDGWSQVGSFISDSMGNVTKQMANSAQVMLDAVRRAHPDRNQGNFWVERRFHCPTIHKLFFGTSDVVALVELEDGTMVLHVWDFKNGVMTVEHVENEQGMYYACGALEDLNLWSAVAKVVIHIVQPNGFHPDGQVRAWETTPDHLVEWMEDVLIPGMDAATEVLSATSATGRACPECDGEGHHMIQGEFPVPCKTCKGKRREPVTFSLETNSGEHCRFCPVRTHACPQLTADMEELDQMMQHIDKVGADALTNEQIGRFLALLETAKIVGKAAEGTAFKRISNGARIDGWKLAHAISRRQWKEGAEQQAAAEFGANAYTPAELKSPAQIDDIPLGAAFTTRWAFKPDTGLKLVKGSDARAEVSTDTKALFTAVKPVLALAAPASEAIPAPPSGRRKKPALSLVAAAG